MITFLRNRWTEWRLRPSKATRDALATATLAQWEKELEERSDALVEKETVLAYKERALEQAVENNNATVDEMSEELEAREAELSDAIDQNTKMMLSLYLSEEKRRLNVH